MLKTDNIQKLIDRLRSDAGRHLKMKDWASFLESAAEHLDDNERGLFKAGNRNSAHRWIECNTAMCLCGWINLIRIEEEGPERLERFKRYSNPNQVLGDTGPAARWLGLDTHQSDFLFHICEPHPHYPSGRENVMFTREFDALAADVRVNAAINVLETLRDTGEVKWRQALLQAGVTKRELIDNMID